MTDTTTTTTGIEQLATQAPAATTEIANTVNTAASVAADATPAAHDLTSALIVDGTLNVLIAFL